MARLFVLSSEFPPGPGGIGTHAWQLCTQLHRLGWIVNVGAAQDYVSDEDILAHNQQQPFPIERLASRQGILRGGLRRVLRTFQQVRKMRPDVVLGTGDSMVYLAAVLARCFGLPWVAVEHGRCPSGWERAVKRLAFNRATSVVCVSEYTRNRLLKLGVKPRTTSVIPNGADDAFFRPLAKAEVEGLRRALVPSDASLLITVGNVTERKGQATVIRALPSILKRAPKTHYLCVGLPSRKEELLGLARTLGVEGHVHFTGQVARDDLLSWLNAADIFVMTSKDIGLEWEGFGIAVVEAALCGKPAIVNANSGLSEAIIEGVTGFGIAEIDPNAVAEAVLALVQDETLRLKMGSAARLHALRSQTWEKRIASYDKLLHGLANRAGCGQDSSSCPTNVGQWEGNVAD